MRVVDKHRGVALLRPAYDEYLPHAIHPYLSLATISQTRIKRVANSLLYRLSRTFLKWMGWNIGAAQSSATSQSPRPDLPIGAPVLDKAGRVVGMLIDSPTELEVDG